MKRTSGATVCLICFESIEKRIFVPSDGPAKIFGNCITYLHSTLIKDALKDIQLNNENQLPLCKNCFDSALELTQLSEQLTTVQKGISDLTVAFSMAVFHRRSQVYSLSEIQNKNSNNSSKVEFYEACLPPNLFSGQNDQNVHHHKNSHRTVININSLQTPTDIMRNVDHESCLLEFDNLPNLPRIPESSLTNNAEEMQFNPENRDQQWIQPKIESSKNLISLTEMGIVHLEGEKDSKTCTDGNNEMQVTKANLLKSIQMPAIKLERINIESREADASFANSFKRNGEPRQKILDVAPFKDDEMADPSYVPNNSSRGEKSRKREKRIVRRSEKNINARRHIRRSAKHLRCSLCPKKFFNQNKLELHERMHTGNRPFNCCLCEKTFISQTAVQHHEKTHGEEKPFQCSLCETRFYHASSLRRHEETHGEKFQCSICKNRYSYLGTLRRHQITHHEGTSSSRVKKNKKIVGNQKRRKVHQSFQSKKMSSLECSFCKHQCGSLAHLELHENMHINGVMNFKCSFCQITFATDKDKIVHEKTHRSDGGLNDEDLIVGI